MMLLGLFKRRRRHVFRFRAEGRWEYRDPAEVRRNLNELNPNWSDLVDAVTKAAKPLPDALDAPPEMAAARASEAEAGVKELAKTVAEAFGVKPLAADGTGMTEAERIDLLAEYLEWCAGVMRTTRPL
jgi:hypothetical protein